MPIGPTSGFLDFTNATPRADVIIALSNVGVGTDVPLHALDIRGTANVADIIINNDLTLIGGLTTNTLTINSVSMSTTSNFQQVTNVGNATTNTVQFTNPTTGLAVTSNAEVGGELSVSGNVTVSQELSVSGNVEVGTANLFVDTTTGNVGVGTTEPTESLDIVGNLNLQKVSNTASIKLNSNVVMELTKTARLMSFPKDALTSNTTPEGYFVAQAPGTVNTETNRQAWVLFNHTYVNDPSGGLHLYASNNRYNSSGDYIGGESLGGVSGDWVYIKLPHKIKLQSIDYWIRYSDNRNAKDATVLGSTDGINWTFVGSWRNADFTELTSVSLPSNAFAKNFPMNSSKYYNYYGFVFEKLSANSSGYYVNFAELELHGYKEYDDEATGVDVVHRSIPSVPNTDLLEVYYDGQDYTSMPETVADKSGNGLTGTPNGDVGFDTEYKAFTFDGSGDYISGTLSNPAGDWSYSTSVWFKTTDLSGGQQSIFHIGTQGTDGKAIELRIKDLTEIYYIHWVRDIYYQNLSLLENRWYHACMTYGGGGNQNGNMKLYLDGILLNPSQLYGSGNLDIDANAPFVLGSERSPIETELTGSIANFRLFNRTLGANEVWQLYAYQKEYFGHGNLGMVLKSGRLGIGTPEPRAVLDVRGTALVGGIPYGPGATPRFLLRRESTVKTTTAAGVVQFDYAEVDSHNGFNSSTYKYTVQVAGTYFLIGGVLIRNTSGNGNAAGSRIEIRVNQGIQDSRFFSSYGAGKYNTEVTTTVQGITYLDVGDIVFMYHTAISNGDVYISHIYQSFSGFLLC